MTVSNFHPTDGAALGASDSVWTTLRSLATANGSLQMSAITKGASYFLCDIIKWYQPNYTLGRFLFKFYIDPAVIPKNAQISAAVFRIKTEAINTIAAYWAVYATNTSIGTIATTDFSKLSLTAAPISDAINVTTDSTVYDFTLNNFSQITSGGYFSFYLREYTHDGQNVEWPSDTTRAFLHMINIAETYPLLIITHDVDLAGTSSIRHIYRPGSYRAELTFGGSSGTVDEADLTPVPTESGASITDAKIKKFMAGIAAGDTKWSEIYKGIYGKEPMEGWAESGIEGGAGKATGEIAYGNIPGMTAPSGIPTQGTSIAQSTKTQAELMAALDTYNKMYQATAKPKPMTNEEKKQAMIQQNQGK
jgi:hypothetical protein